MRLSQFMATVMPDQQRSEIHRGWAGPTISSTPGLVARAPIKGSLIPEAPLTQRSAVALIAKHTDIARMQSVRSQFNQVVEGVGIDGQGLSTLRRARSSRLPRGLSSPSPVEAGQTANGQ